MSNLTDTQIQDLARFSNEVEEYLNNNSTPLKGNAQYRHMTKAAFGKVFKATTRLGGLRRVMNSTTFYEEHGRTKMTQQKRYAKGHPKEGELVYDGQGNRILEPKRCVLYSAEAYRQMRQERTGLKTPETVYFVKWAEVPENVREKIATKFPYPVEGKAQFLPTNLCLVFRKGDKPARGESRHTWMPPQFVVSGKYGDDAAVLTKAVVWNRGCLKDLAEAIGIKPVDLTNPEVESTEENVDLKKAANVTSLIQAGAVVLDEDFLF